MVFDQGAIFTYIGPWFCQQVIALWYGRRPVPSGRTLLGARGRFFARCAAVDGGPSVEVLKAAAKHKGASVVEVLQNCVIFNDGTHNAVAKKEVI